MKFNFGLLIFSFLILNCSNLKVKSDQLQLNQNKDLFAKIILKDSIVKSENDLILSVCIVNNSLKNQELQEEQVLKNPILSLSILNEKGVRILSCPPVTPKHDSTSGYVKILKPKEKYEFEYLSLNSCEPLPKGKYKITMNFIDSDIKWFEIK